MPMNDPIIAYLTFVDGARRPVFEQPDGRQYVLDDDGERVHGVWLIPPDGGVDLPLIVSAQQKRSPGSVTPATGTVPPSGYSGSRNTVREGQGCVKQFRCTRALCHSQRNAASQVTNDVGQLHAQPPRAAHRHAGGDGFPNSRSVSSLFAGTNARLAGSGSDSYFPIRIGNPQNLSDATNNVEWPNGGSYADSEVYTIVQQITAQSTAMPPGFSTSSRPLLIYCVGYGSIFDPSIPSTGQTHALTFLRQYVHGHEPGSFSGESNDLRDASPAHRQHADLFFQHHASRSTGLPHQVEADCRPSIAAYNQIAACGLA